MHPRKITNDDSNAWASITHTGTDFSAPNGVPCWPSAVVGIWKVNHYKGDSILADTDIDTFIHIDTILPV